MNLTEPNLENKSTSSHGGSDARARTLRRDTRAAKVTLAPMPSLPKRPNRDLIRASQAGRLSWSPLNQ
eukprot:6175392-Pleurochrysis_carterae.AAC.2